MSGSKYGKYFIQYDPDRWPKRSLPPGRKPGLIVARLDNNVVQGSNFCVVVWFQPGSTPRFNCPKSGHPLHIHKDAELLFHIGTNPDDPMDIRSTFNKLTAETILRDLKSISEFLYHS